MSWSRKRPEDPNITIGSHKHNGGKNLHSLVSQHIISLDLLSPTLVSHDRDRPPSWRALRRRPPSPLRTRGRAAAAAGRRPAGGPPACGGGSRRSRSAPAGGRQAYLDPGFLSSPEGDREGEGGRLDIHPPSHPVREPRVGGGLGEPENGVIFFLQISPCFSDG